MQYEITIFPSIKQPQNMKQYKVSFTGLANFLTKQREPVAKIQQVSWSPYTFKGKRSNKTAGFSNLAVFDFDENTLPLQQIEAILHEQELQHILHTTFSYTEQKQKYRVILPLDFQCAAADQKALFSAMTHYAQTVFKMTPDRACKDAARSFFTSYKTTEQVLRTSCILTGNTIAWEKLMLHHKNLHAAATSKRKEAIKAKKKITIQELQKMKSAAHDALFAKGDRYITKSDEKRYFYALAACDAEIREESAKRLGMHIDYEPNEEGELVATIAKGFTCPYCERNDATFFYVDPLQGGGAFCAHVKSCSEVYKPKREGQYRVMSLGYVCDIGGII